MVLRMKRSQSFWASSRSEVNNLSLSLVMPDILLFRKGFWSRSCPKSFHITRCAVYFWYYYERYDINFFSFFTYLVQGAKASFSILENRQIEAFLSDSFMSLRKLRRTRIIKKLNHFRVVISKRFDKGPPTGSNFVLILHVGIFLNKI